MYFAQNSLYETIIYNITILYLYIKLYEQTLFKLLFLLLLIYSAVIRILLFILLLLW